MKTFILFLALAVSAFAQSPAVRGNINASSVNPSPASGGAATFSSITDSGLTAGRLVYTGTGGLLSASDQFTFDNTATGIQVGSTITGGFQMFATVDKVTNVQRLDQSINTTDALFGTRTVGTGSTVPVHIFSQQSTALGSYSRIDVLRGAALPIFQQGLYTSTTGTTNASSGVAGNFLSIGNLNSTATSGSVGILGIFPVYNQAASSAANTDILVNRTQTSVGSGAQLFIDGQVGGVSQFSVSNQGGISVKQGTNARAGTFTLVAGTVTVANTSITANSVIEFTIKTVSGTVTSAPYIASTVVGTSFTVAGAATNNSTYNYVIFEAAP